MKLVKTVIEVEFNDQKFNLTKPTRKQAQDYRNALIKLDESGDATDAMKEFIQVLGMPEGVFDNLEIGHITEIMEALTGSKKN